MGIFTQFISGFFFFHLLNSFNKFFILFKQFFDFVAIIIILLFQIFQFIMLYLRFAFQPFIFPLIFRWSLKTRNLIRLNILILFLKQFLYHFQLFYLFIFFVQLVRVVINKCFHLIYFRNQLFIFLFEFVIIPTYCLFQEKVVIVYLFQLFVLLFQQLLHMMNHSLEIICTCRIKLSIEIKQESTCIHRKVFSVVFIFN